jgi:hypothetical protein
MQAYSSGKAILLLKYELLLPFLSSSWNNDMWLKVLNEK